LREETPRTKRKDKRKGGDNKEQRKSDKKEETNVNNKKICKYCEGYGELASQTGDDKTHVSVPIVLVLDGLLRSDGKKIPLGENSQTVESGE